MDGPTVDGRPVGTAAVEVVDPATLSWRACSARSHRNSAHSVNRSRGAEREIHEPSLRRDRILLFSTSTASLFFSFWTRRTAFKMPASSMPAGLGPQSACVVQRSPETE